LPCNTGECVKIIRLEDGSLRELVGVFLDITKKGIPTGSVVVLGSATHLQMRGVGGYAFDLAGEMDRLNKRFKGGLVIMPGVPIFMGGTNDRTVIRAVIELGRWFHFSGTRYLKKTWDSIAADLILESKGGTYITEIFRHNMPENLADYQTQRSWVSGGWASPCEAHPCSPELEERITKTMICELNNMFNLQLGHEPILDRTRSEPVPGRMKFLTIGGSHSIREGKSLAAKGYDVLTCAIGGWKPTESACKEMTASVEKSLASLTNDDIVVVHCWDNIAFMARTEEGGDLPIRKDEKGKHHVEGEIVLAGKDRLYMFFKNCIPFLKLLDGRRVLFLTPMPRYIYTSCCTASEHAPNRVEDDFERVIRQKLIEVRDYFKDFIFTSGIRGTVLNPGLCVPEADEDGNRLWGTDPVHPLQAGYDKIAELIIGEATKAKTKKRMGEPLASNRKRIRLEPATPRWVGETSTNIATQSTGFGVPRGNFGGRGGRGGRPRARFRGSMPRGGYNRGGY